MTALMQDPLIYALAFNIVVLAPVLLALAFGRGAIDGAFGPDTPARRILACIYLAIALASGALIAFRLHGAAWTTIATLTLFAVQIAYKSGTVFAVGLRNPVVATNILVIVIQLAAVGLLLTHA